jgi:hypothetical protein
VRSGAVGAETLEQFLADGECLRFRAGPHGSVITSVFPVRAVSTPPCYDARSPSCTVCDLSSDGRPAERVGHCCASDARFLLPLIATSACRLLAFPADRCTTSRPALSRRTRFRLARRAARHLVAGNVGTCGGVTQRARPTWRHRTRGVAPIRCTRRRRTGLGTFVSLSHAR